MSLDYTAPSQTARLLQAVGRCLLYAQIIKIFVRVHTICTFGVVVYFLITFISCLIAKPSTNDIGPISTTRIMIECIFILNYLD